MNFICNDDNPKTHTRIISEFKIEYCDKCWEESHQ